MEHVNTYLWIPRMGAYFVILILFGIGKLFTSRDSAHFICSSRAIAHGETQKQEPINFL